MSSSTLASSSSANIPKTTISSTTPSRTAVSAANPASASSSMRSATTTTNEAPSAMATAVKKPTAITATSQVSSRPRQAHSTCPGRLTCEHRGRRRPDRPDGLDRPSVGDCLMPSENQRPPAPPRP
ncbi:hypothetical protein [Streptomyces sp. SAS_260]|uniref:hypothetical protein n=1 Tax=Streptomyces sp. SAS_260 TaxID=3412751 RepID=UPI00403CB09C